MSADSVSTSGRMGAGTHAWRLLVRTTLRAYLAALAILGRVRPKRRRASDRVQVLLTGTFHSHNWIRAHLGPLAASPACARVTMVTTASLPDLPGVVAVFPPRWLVNAIGAVPARLLTFAIVAVTTRPDIVGGFHLLVNGLVAILVARCTGAAAWYYSVGGITEVRDGGVWGENPYFARLRAPDPIVERQLIAALAHVDLVITMGSSAVREFRARGVDTRFEIVAGGLAAPPPAQAVAPPSFDLILVARLVPIKRIDRFVDLVATLRLTVPTITAVIVGSGPLRDALASRAAARGVADAITFAGQQDDVNAWLRRSRVFVLTSESEGLALSMMEAMMAGLPAVVPRVGDLADLVDEGHNGHLIDDPTPERFAAAITPLLMNADVYGEFAAAARTSARRYTSAAATAKWTRILGGGVPQPQRASVERNSEDAVLS